MTEPTTKQLLARWHRESARRAVRRAIRAGRLLRPSCCEVCGRTAKLDAHHRNGYESANALDVTFLCHNCHTLAHRPGGIAQRHIPDYVIEARRHPGFFWLDRLMRGESLGAELTEEQQREADRIAAS